jgi:uncharacterized damage-inducible protein DinB
MNYYAAKELAESFRTVRQNTLTIAEDIAEEKYTFRPAPDTRTVAELFAHIAIINNRQYQSSAVERRTSFEGVDFQALIKQIKAEEAEPRSKAQTLELLRTSGEQWAAYLDGVTEKILAERVLFPASPSPVSKTRFEIILGVKEHEMHHRGQLMLIERLLGIVPHLTRRNQARLAAAGIKV